jgi:hypothetical protein
MFQKRVELRVLKDPFGHFKLAGPGLGLLFAKGQLEYGLGVPLR